MEAEEKEKLWLMKRCGKITSSAIGKLMVSGRREMTPSELDIAKKQGVKRKTVDVPFGIQLYLIFIRLQGKEG